MNQPVNDAPTTHTVDNPDWVALDALRKSVVAAESSLGTALKSAAEAMSAGSAWTGPVAAKAFTTEIEGRSSRLPGLVQQILHAVEDELAVTPRTKTVQNHPGLRAV